MPYISTAEAKAALRAQIRSQQRQLTGLARQVSDGLLFDRLLQLPVLAQAQTVLLYHGMGAEPDTKRLVPALLSRGKRIALPRCLAGNMLEARLVTGDSPLIRHPYGMLEPDEARPLLPQEEIDFILVPGLAFDRAGHRLGQGGGYYDRFLNGARAAAVALCRDQFLQSAVPYQDHDQRVDYIITESAFIECSGSAGQDPSGPAPRQCPLAL